MAVVDISSGIVLTPLLLEQKAEESPIHNPRPVLILFQLPRQKIKDQGSSIKHASIVVQGVQGVPCEGVIDTGSDITIIGGKLFKKIAVVARLRKRDFRSADKTPIAYGWQPFTLHGKMSFSISFEDREMVTPVYIKMDSEEPLTSGRGSVQATADCEISPRSTKE